MELKFYNPETKTEHELVYKRRTGALREKMRQMTAKQLEKLDLLTKLQTFSVDKGLMREDFTERLAQAVEDGFITKEELKQYLLYVSTHQQQDTDKYILETWQLICEPKEQIFTELWNKPVTSKGKINDFWLEQDIVEVEENVKSFRAIMGK